MKNLLTALLIAGSVVGLAACESTGMGNTETNVPYASERTAGATDAPAPAAEERTFRATQSK